MIKEERETPEGLALLLRHCAQLCMQRERKREREFQSYFQLTVTLKKKMVIHHWRDFTDTHNNSTWKHDFEETLLSNVFEKPLNRCFVMTSQKKTQEQKL